jgi:uncharacterized protein with GYD domain
MVTYVSLFNWTDTGIKSVKETLNRSEENRRAIEQAGGRLIAVYWTQGAYDVVAVTEWPDEETGMAFLLALGMRGNVRSETLRAFSAEDMQRILQKTP